MDLLKTIMREINMYIAAQGMLEECTDYTQRNWQHNEIAELAGVYIARAELEVKQAQKDEIRKRAIDLIRMELRELGRHPND